MRFCVGGKPQNRNTIKTSPAAAALSCTRMSKHTNRKYNHQPTICTTRQTDADADHCCGGIGRVYSFVHSFSMRGGSASSQKHSIRPRWREMLHRVPWNLAHVNRQIHFYIGWYVGEFIRLWPWTYGFQLSHDIQMSAYIFTRSKVIWSDAHQRFNSPTKKKTFACLCGRVQQQPKKSWSRNCYLLTALSLLRKISRFSSSELVWGWFLLF